jgi:putative Holliday junction resolvase
MRVLAIDYGAKAIGVAVCDELQLAARPLTTIRREKLKRPEVLDRICALVNETEAGELVVGLPLNMDGSHGEAAVRVENFMADLRGRLSIPIIPVDERLSSREADQLLREMGVPDRERRARSDEYAAMIILRDYLDAQSRKKIPLPETHESHATDSETHFP